MTFKNKNLLLIGPIPNPKGGVSIHISRLKSLLNTDFNIRLIDESSNRKPEIYNIRSMNIFKYIQLILWADIVHIHSGVTVLRSFHIIASRLCFKKVVVTMHSLSHQTPFKIFINKVMLRLANRNILVSGEIQHRLNLKNFVIKEAFLPPSTNTSNISSHIKDWLNKNTKNNKNIAISNASVITLHDGIDLYGFDICIEAIQQLKYKHNINICLLLMISEAISNSDELILNYHNLVKKYQLENDVLITQEDASFSDIISYSDVVLRATSTDGDALSIREALYFNKPVIASDVVKRPSGTIIFANRNPDDLCQKIMESLPDKSSGEEAHTAPSNESSYIQFYLDLYNSL